MNVAACNVRARFFLPALALSAILVSGIAYGQIAPEAGAAVEGFPAKQTTSLPPPKAGTGFAHMTFGAWRADHYYDVDGTLRELDTQNTRYSQAVMRLTADYWLTDNIAVSADLPLTYYSIASDAQFADRSIVGPSYFGIGGMYHSAFGEFSADVATMLKIPRDFHAGIYDDPDHPTFLSDGYFQETTTLTLGYNTETNWIRGMVGYNWRGEEPLDEIPFSLEVGFTRVSGTGIYAQLQGVVSTGDVKHPASPFYVGASGSDVERSRYEGGRGIFRDIDRENYIGAGAGAFIYVTSKIRLDARYTLRLAGANSLALNGGYVGIGYIF